MFHGLALSGAYEDGYDFSPFLDLVIALTLNFGPSGILLGVGFVPPTTGQSVSRILSDGFHLWTGSSPPVCRRVLTIFSWKLGIMAMSDSAFQS